MTDAVLRTSSRAACLFSQSLACLPLRRSLAPEPGPSRLAAALISTPAVVDPSCSGCMSITCSDAECGTGLTQECTDDCIVVACDDPTHDASSLGDLQLCAECPDQALMCCDDATHFDATWSKELEDLLCACGFGPPHPAPAHVAPHSLHFNHPGPVSCHSSHGPHGDHGYTHSPHNASGVSSLTDSGSAMPPSSHASSQGGTPMTFPTSPPSRSTGGEWLNSQSHDSPLPLSPPGADLAPAGGHRCMWGGCSQAFDDFGALVGHVNLEHLRPTDVPAVRPTTKANPIPTPSHTPVASPLTNGTVQAVPQGWHSWESAGGATDQVGQTVTAMDWPNMPSLSTDSSSYATPAAPSVSGRSSSVFSSSSPLLSAASSTGDPPRMLSLPPRGPSADAEDGVHTCRWQGCSVSLSTSAALNAHIDEEHIGSGQGHYDCHWADCNRHGDNGFSSKQKVRRHIQTHTGHRPFPCTVCGQTFSEAATLAQHMRRHNRDKPYVCDFPGCGKSFTVTGALTIHKRTHSGTKPFKCTYCDKAFAESSNLSKHLRTHTGARPYSCTECERTFARPDQLSRHMNVHRKGAAAAVVDQEQGAIAVA